MNILQAITRNIAKRGFTARIGHLVHDQAFLSVDKNAIANPAMSYCKTLKVHQSRT